MANQTTAQHAQTITINKFFYSGIACLLDNREALAHIDQLSAADAGYLHSCCEAANGSLSRLLETAALLVDEKLNGHRSIIEDDRAAQFLIELTATVSGLNSIAFELSQTLAIQCEKARAAKGV